MITAYDNSARIEDLKVVYLTVYDHHMLLVGF